MIGCAKPEGRRQCNLVAELFVHPFRDTGYEIGIRQQGQVVAVLFERSNRADNNGVFLVNVSDIDPALISVKHVKSSDAEI
jgi:hypothetical protein